MDSKEILSRASAGGIGKSLVWKWSDRDWNHIWSHFQTDFSGSRPPAEIRVVLSFLGFQHVEWPSINKEWDDGHMLESSKEDRNHDSYLLTIGERENYFENERIANQI